jgi:hypothetical protein
MRKIKQMNGMMMKQKAGWARERAAWWAKLGAGLVVALLLVGCEDEPPAGAGEGCDAGRGGDACEGGLTCQPDAAGANICQRELGGECTPGTAPTYCLLNSTCIASATDPAKGSCLVEAGNACDATATNSFCAPQTACTAADGGEAKCLVEPGGPCDLAAAEPGCGRDFACLAKEDGEGACLIPAGGACDGAAAEAHCETGTGCVDDGAGQTACLIPLGGGCDTAAPHCVPASECFEIPAEEGQAGAEAQAECRIPRGGACDEAAPDPFCAPALMCATLEAGDHACHPHVYIKGTVHDALSDEAIEGAHVIARNEEQVAVTDVAVSDAEGKYQLELPTVRDAAGKPLDFAYTLRGAAMQYAVFPGGLRSALPIFGSEATEQDEAWVIEGALTQIALLPLEDQTKERFQITGSISAAGDKAGVLVVAKGAGEAWSAISDRQGDFTLFNVANGEQEVKGYAAGLQLVPAQVNVQGADVTDVVLSEADGALVTVTGSVQIVNAFGGAVTSVILVVDDTFDEGFVRGEAPPGMRSPKTGAPDVSGNFSIEGVPEGRYVVLAAFENDRLVRDPDTNISGTSLVRVDVTSADAPSLTIPSSFKITEALEVVTPGAGNPEEVTSAPVLTWKDDSSEDSYQVKVFNAYGDLVWEKLDVPKSTGGDVKVPYEGPLEPGMYYQFRATSWRSPGGKAAPISATEDLKGVFYMKKP